MSKAPTPPDFDDDSPDVQIVPMDERGGGSADVYKPPQRVFKVNFSFANDPKVQARKRKPSSPPKIQTQMTDFKTASGGKVEKGQMKPVYAPKPTSSRTDDGSGGQENGAGARYLGGTRRVLFELLCFLTKLY